jgi:hypothetical protein
MRGQDEENHQANGEKIVRVGAEKIVNEWPHPEPVEGCGRAYAEVAMKRESA